MIEDRERASKGDLENQWCVEYYVSEGYSQGDAQKKCAETQKDNLRLLKGDAELEASDSLEIVNREATPMERCISAVMDIRGEDLDTATRTCSKMFNDPMYKHAFESGDAWKMGAAMHKWSYNHDAKWASARERDRQEQKNMKRGVAEIIEEIHRNRNDPDYYTPDVALTDRAERIYKMRQEGKAIKATRARRQERLTVGDLYGKTKQQIIAEQTADQRDYGKTHNQIVDEIRAQIDAEERLKKLRRGEKSE